MKLKNKKKNIFVAGHKGMVGSAILRKLKKDREKIILTTISKKKLNLLNKNQVLNFFKKKKFTHVYLCAAKVGGIKANIDYPYDFLNINLNIQNNIINACLKTNVKNLAFFGSSCIYPVLNRPILEEDLLKSKFEKTNEYYAIAKITGLKLCTSMMKQFSKKNLKYISLMPCNLFGPNDNYNTNNSHVFAALIKKFLIAKRKKLKFVYLWGNGRPKREFLHVDELAKISIEIMNTPRTKLKKISPDLIFNVGSGQEISIQNLANLIAKGFSYKGKVLYQSDKPNGAYRKIMNISKIQRLGFETFNLKESITKHIEYIKSLNYKNLKKIKII
jgi:GDP-L-fucose synthase